MTQKKRLGDRAASGIAWVTGQSVFARFISYFAQLALAWFLTEGDFGIFGLALTISEFCRVFNQGGVSKVLIHRQRSFDRWVTPGFWLSLAMGTLVSIVMIATGYITCGLFPIEDKARLFQLVCLLAVVTPVNAIGTIPRAALAIELRFRAIAVIAAAMLIFGSLLKVGLAWAGFGAFSFVIPMVVIAPVQAICFWVLARPKVKMNLMTRKWKYLFSDSMMIIATSFWYKIITHGDYVILAALATQQELGLYFFAFNYAVQAIIMFTQGIASISLPALASLNRQPERQLEAFRKGAAVLAAIVFPACVAQAVLFKPVVEEFFPSIWIPAIPMLQLLSLGMAARTVSWVSASLMEAQGRFRTRMWLGLFSAIVFVIMGLAGALLGRQTSIGAPVGLALAVTLYYPLMSLATTWLVLPPTADRRGIIKDICLPPALLGVLAFVPIYLVSVSLTGNRYIHIALVAVPGSLLYILLGRIWMKPVWLDVTSRLRRLLPARFSSLKSGT